MGMKVKLAFIASIAYSLLTLLIPAWTQAHVVEKHSLNSKYLKEQRPVNVIFPKNYNIGSTNKFDALYVLDGEWNISLAEKVYQFLEYARFISTNMIIVSVPNYYRDGMNMRDRDFTPTLTENKDGKFSWMKSSLISGDASNPLLFPKEELVPFVRQDTHKIKIINNDLLIEVYVNGKGPYNFLFDTGASGIGRIDSRVVEELNLSVVDSIQNYDGSGNYQIEPLVGLDKLAVGNVKVYDVRLMSRNYNKSHKEGDIRTDGIIGRDFFKDYLIKIDCPNNALIISNGSLNSKDSTVSQYTEAFQIRGKIESIDPLFHFDTGSNMSFHIPKSIIDRLSYRNTNNRRIARKANTEYVIQEAILESKIQVGSIEVENQLVGYSEKATYINVGMKFLKNYKITIDQKNKLFKIE
jgi:predicted aspartyl protease